MTTKVQRNPLDMNIDRNNIEAWKLRNTIMRADGVIPDGWKTVTSDLDSHRVYCPLIGTIGAREVKI
jgi:hypothetical protein